MTNKEILDSKDEFPISLDMLREYTRLLAGYAAVKVEDIISRELIALKYDEQTDK